MTPPSGNSLDGVGAVKAGANVSIGQDGTISATGGGGNANIATLDTIAPLFNGSTQTFALKYGGQSLPASVTSNYVFLSVGGILQSPGVSYNISNGSVTFTEAPPAGSSFAGRAILSIPASGGEGGVQSIDFQPPLTGGTITDVGQVGIANASPTQSGAMTAAYAAKVESLGTNGTGDRFISDVQPTAADGDNGDIWYLV